MKIYTILFLLVATLITAEAQVSKRITHVDKQNYEMLKDLGDPKLSNPSSSAIILIGDTQTYTRRRTNTNILNLMMSWIVSQEDILNIKAVLGVGDIVELNNKIKFRSEELADVKNGYTDESGLYRQGNVAVDHSSTQMWEAVSNAYGQLDNRIPYFITTGNHDHGHKWGDARYSRFNEFFNADRNYKNFKALREVGVDEFGKDALQNAVYKLELGGKWGDLYVMLLEFKPRLETIRWAQQILAKPQYKGKRFILITHAFIDVDGTLSNEKWYKVEGMSADQVWKDFVAKHSEIKAVFCGHHCRPSNDFIYSTHFKYLQNEVGKNVAVMLFDPQTLGGGFSGNGGDGWLRILELLPDGETVKVKTFSPLFAISPMTKHFAWRTADFDMFDFKIEK